MIDINKLYEVKDIKSVTNSNGNYRIPDEYIKAACNWLANDLKKHQYKRMLDGFWDNRSEIGGVVGFTKDNKFYLFLGKTNDDIDRKIECLDRFNDYSFQELLDFKYISAFVAGNLVKASKDPHPSTEEIYQYIKQNTESLGIHLYDINYVNKHQKLVYVLVNKLDHDWSAGTCNLEYAQKMMNDNHDVYIKHAEIWQKDQKDGWIFVSLSDFYQEESNMQTLESGTYYLVKWHKKTYMVAYIGYDYDEYGMTYYLFRINGKLIDVPLNEDDIRGFVPDEDDLDDCIEELAEEMREDPCEWVIDLELCDKVD